MKTLPSPEYLQSFMMYRDGMLFGMHRPPDHFCSVRMQKIWNTKFVGKRLGRGGNRYRRLMVDGRDYLEHRILLAVCGIVSDGLEVDHIDGNPTNNRLENLRVCDHSENMRNFPGWSKKSLRVGVYQTSNGKFQSNIRAEGRIIHLGTFSDPEEASAARRAAELKFYGAFAVLESRT